MAAVMFDRAWRCVCGQFAKLPEEGVCESCARHRCYGRIIHALTTEVDEVPLSRITLDALDALADLMAGRGR